MDYTEIKQHYNQLMLDHFPYMKNKVDTSENHLKQQYSMQWLETILILEL